MKREIACTRCVRTWRDIAQDPEIVAAGEQVDIVAGNARGTMICDGCNVQIVAGLQCYAVTVTTREQRPYPPWARGVVDGGDHV